ncbi:MAG: hypothetical protein V2B19_32810 [Pseudomonadota bacterium]
MKKLFVFLACLFISPVVFADDATIIVRTEYHLTETGAVRETFWNFKRTNATTCEVFAPGETEPVIVMRLGPNQVPDRVEKRKLLNGDASAIIENRQASILLSDGFPVPYDFLAPFEATQAPVVLKRQAGGSVFRQTYEKRIEFFSFSEIQSGGFLSENMVQKYSGEKFRKVSIYNGEQIVVLQIWPENGDWWVYEETAGRRSWRKE